jgi:hypothetical protein
VDADILDRFVSMSLGGKESQAGEVLLFGGATIPHGYDTRPRKAIFPDFNT